MITRKNFLIGASATAATASAIDGESIAGGWGRARGLLGGAFMGVMLAQQSKTYTARDYVQDGLVALFDGVENAGYGQHVDEPNWTNLADGHTYSMPDATVVYDQFVRFSPNNKFSTDFADIGNQFCIETVSRIAYAPDKLNNVSGNCVYKSCGVACFRKVQNEASGILVLSFVMSDGKVHYYGTTPTAQDGVKEANDEHFPSPFRTRCCNFSLRSDFAPYLNGKPRVGRHSMNYADAYDGKSVLMLGSANSTSTDLSCFRLYSRHLSPSEIAANYAVDKARFNLP